MSKFTTPYLPIGTVVKSRYRARWTGTIEIVGLHASYGCNVVQVRITHDRNGRPMRKPFLSIPLSTYWLETV